MKLVCFGDSITARNEGLRQPMLTLKLAKKLDGFDIINAGVAGDNTNMALGRIEEDVIKHNPDLVTVLFGSNDAAFHKKIDIDTYRTNLYKITDLIKPNKSILITPPPVDEELQFARTNEELNIYAQVVREVAYHTESPVIDFFKHMISMKNYTEILKGSKNDGLHFGEEGYEILVNLIIEGIYKDIKIY
ncbi:SGNH/GDSL hydrolase family protein [Virgibacillus flavescens]|uniref:SGNH/GDSL hydrolase family protein n=1 Tax=Virgibacillus flavescens TaxID=1611422 RepID=UPI003D33A4D8